MIDFNRPLLVSRTAVAVILGLCVLGVLFVTVTSADVGDYYNNSAEWCEDRGGELYNEHAMIDGGLYCHLDNGTSVRMADVIEVSD